MTDTIIGKIHNARRVTFDGRDLWVASICDAQGKFIVRAENVSEHETAALARAWLVEFAYKRGLMLVIEEEFHVG